METFLSSTILDEDSSKWLVLKDSSICIRKCCLASRPVSAKQNETLSSSLKIAWKLAPWHNFAWGFQICTWLVFEKPSIWFKEEPPRLKACFGQIEWNSPPECMETYSLAQLRVRIPRCVVSFWKVIELHQEGAARVFRRVSAKLNETLRPCLKIARKLSLLQKFMQGLQVCGLFSKIHAFASKWSCRVIRPLSVKFNGTLSPCLRKAWELALMLDFAWGFLICG